jgi:alanyl-tRNA synthetase
VLKDPINSRWIETSLEFCGGTHVTHTGTINHFMIIEEEAIAKGVRRLVALTGNEAQKAKQRSLDFAQRISTTAIVNSDMVGLLLRDLETLTLRLADKADYRRQLLTLKETHDRAAKAVNADLAEQAINTVKQQLLLLLEQQQQSPSFLVTHLNVKANTKALLQAINYVKEHWPNIAVLLVSSDTEHKKVVHVSHVPDPLVARGLQAHEWTQTLANIVGGKCGGKASSAQGTGTTIDRVEEGLHLARVFAQLRLDGEGGGLPTFQ